MMLGFLLARAGIEVIVLEKHKDFLRDFRGDTIHPSTLELMHELGLLDEFLKLPHQEVSRLSFQIGGERIADGRFQPSADALQVHRADAAVGLPQFPRRTGQALSRVSSADAGGGHRSDQRRRPRRGPSRPDAGRRRRDSRRARGRLRRPPFHVRERAGLPVEDVGAPIDVLWFRLSRHAERHRGDRRSHRGRPDARHAQSRRLLAMRLRHPEGRHRSGEARRPAGVSRPCGRAVAVRARPRRRA